MKFAFVIWALFFSFQTFAATMTAGADTCSDVDVRDGFSTELKTYFATPLRQGNLGWCFGYSAAELLSQAVGQPVSAVHVSTYYASSVGALGRFGRFFAGGTDTVVESGMIKYAVKNMLDLGYVCGEKEVPSVLIRTVYIGDHRPYDRGLELLFRNIEADRQGRCDAFCHDMNNQLARAFFPGKSVKEVLEYFASHANESMDKSAFTLFDSMCTKKHVTIPPGRFEMKSEGGVLFGGSQIQQIDQLLNQKKLVGIEYNTKYIYEEDALMHASVVLARKKIKNQCYYLVKNTRGKDCKGYKKGIVCDALQGTYWVNRETMDDMATRLTWIEKR